MTYYSFENQSSGSICIDKNCIKRANFGFIHNSQATYCATHKKDGMENIKRKQCRGEGCKTAPTFNYPYLKDCIYCTKCKYSHTYTIYAAMYIMYIYIYIYIYICIGVRETLARAHCRIQCSDHAHVRLSMCCPRIG